MLQRAAGAVMLFRRVASISPAAADEALRRGELQLVDVREADELAEGAVAGAILVPLGELAGRVGELERERLVAFICRSGNRSAMATRTARRAGLNAVNVKGGVLAWSRAGLPLTTRRARGIP